MMMMMMKTDTDINNFIYFFNTKHIIKPLGQNVSASMRLYIPTIY